MGSLKEEMMRKEISFKQEIRKGGGWNGEEAPYPKFSPSIAQEGATDSKNSETNGRQTIVQGPQKATRGQGKGRKPEKR